MPRRRHGTLYAVLALRLTKARDKKGLSQTEVADRLGYEQSTISSIEGGGRRVDYFELQELANLYGESVEDLTRAPTPAEEDEADTRIRRPGPKPKPREGRGRRRKR
jgi:XRE family transcriptional regulator, fatty acid utilization regulator